MILVFLNPYESQSTHCLKLPFYMVPRQQFNHILNEAAI